MPRYDFRDVVRLSELPEDALRDVLEAIIEHLEIEIVREHTPDYSFYEVTSSVVKPLNQ